MREEKRVSLWKARVLAYTTEHGFARFEDRETAFGMHAVCILVDIVDTFGCIAPDIERAETSEIDVMPLSHVGLDSLHKFIDNYFNSRTLDAGLGMNFSYNTRFSHRFLQQ